MQKDAAVLKPDKRNGVILINNVGNDQSLRHLFNNKKKFKQIHKDPTMKQLSTLQIYSRLLFKQGELTEEQNQKLGPQNARVAHAYTLLKTHKTFTVLPKFRPIVDTTSTCYCNVGSYLTELLNQLTQTEFMTRDSFDTVSKINSIPPEVFDNGYILASFEVEILDHLYNNKLIAAQLKKLTLKKANKRHL